MTTPKSDPSRGSSPEQQPGLPPAFWRFNLRSLFRLTTALALILAFFVLPIPISLHWILNGALWIIGATWVVSGILCTRGQQQAFYIGAAIVVSSMWTGVGGRYMQGFHTLFGADRAIGAWIDLALIAMTAIANGIFCAFAHRYFKRNVR